MIVGRSGHLASLDRAMNAAEGGHAASLLLVGPPGMGKSLLLQHARERAMARGWVLAMAAAPAGGADATLALAHDVVHALSRALALPDEPDPTATVLRDMLCDASMTRPVLVMVDDLQWADEQSLAVLTLASGRLTGTRTLVLAAGRPPVAGDPRLHGWGRIEVGPLTEQDAVTLLRRSIRRPLPPDQALRVVRGLDCTPLAIVEVRRLLRPGQIEGLEPIPDPVPVHEQLRRAWCSSAATLPDRTRRALLALAVLDSGDQALLDAVLDDLGCEPDDLDPAHATGLLRTTPGQAPAIASSAARAGVLDSHTADQVRATQRLLAETAQRLGRPPAVVIRHLRAAARVGDDHVGDLLEQQARRAADRDQPDVSAQAWAAAAEVTTDAGHRTARAVHAARIWLAESTSPTGARELLALLSGLPLAPGDLVWREWLRSEVLAETDLSRAAASALAAARHAAETTPTLTPWLLWDAAATAWTAGEPALATEAADDLRHWLARRPEAADAGVPGWLGDAVYGVALLMDGRTTQGAGVVAQARAQAAGWVDTDRTPLTALLTVVALDELMMVDSTTARARVQTLATRLTDDPGSARAAVAVIQAWRSRRGGRWDAAAAMAEEAADVARTVGAGAEERSALSLLVELSAARDDPDAAGVRIETLRRRAAAVGDRRAMASADYAEGVLALAAGDPQAAVRALERVAACPLWGRGCTDAPLAGRIDLVEAYLQAGEQTAARRLSVDLLARLAELDAIDPDAAAIRTRLMALVAPADEAAGVFTAAVQQHAGGRDPAAAARTHLAFARHLLDTHRADLAEPELRQALSTFDLLGASNWIQAVRRRLDLTGAASPAAPDPLEQLTPQERRVARAVATGATNSEVAEALFLSVRTVEFHLSHVFCKLGLRHRSELVHLLSRTDAVR